MGLSYRTKSLLELTLVIVTVMSNIIPYLVPNSILVFVFTIPSALVALLFMIDSRGTHRAERVDLRKRITDEAQTILSRLAWDQNYFDIPHPYWSGKMEELKIELLVVKITSCGKGSMIALKGGTNSSDRGIVSIGVN